MSDKGETGAAPPKRRNNLLWLCADLAGAGWEDADPDVVERVLNTVAALQNAKPAWDRRAAGAVEDEIDGIRKDINNLIRRIEALDEDAKKMARRAARDTPQIQALDGELQEAYMAKDQEKINQLELVLRALRAAAFETVDLVAIQSLRNLRDALQVPEEVAVREAPAEQGRPRNEGAYQTALIAVRFFHEATGAEPTFRTDGDTPFSHFLSAIYAEFGIKADLRKPFDWAMSKLNKQG